RWGPLRTIADLRAEAAAPPVAQPGELVAPMAGGITNLPVLRGLRLLDGYIGVDAQSVLDLTSPVTERVAGTAWRPEGTHWMRIEKTMPRARLVTGARQTADARADLGAIDISAVALVDRAVGVLAGAPGSARIVEDRPGSIAVETSAGGQQLLVVT